MNKNFINRFANFLNKKIAFSPLNQELYIIDICIIDWDLLNGCFGYVSSNKDINNYIHSNLKTFCKDAIKTIHKNTGYIMQEKINPVLKKVNKSLPQLKKTYSFIITDINNCGYSELVVKTLKPVRTDDQKTKIKLMMHNILSTFYIESRLIKKYEIINASKFLNHYQREVYQEINKPIININDNNFTWAIDKERILKTQHLQVLICLIFRYNTEEKEIYFNMIKGTYAARKKQLKKIVCGNEDIKDSELMRSCYKLEIPQTIIKLLSK